jgi:hypothetical protein
MEEIKEKVDPRKDFYDVSRLKTVIGMRDELENELIKFPKQEIK